MAEEKKEKDTIEQLRASDRELLEKLMGLPEDEKPAEPPEEKEIKDMDVIEVCRPGQRIEVINSSRLGIYDREGKYIIESEILNELRSLPKVVTEKVVDHENQSDVYMLKTNIPDILSLEFKLVVNINGARLYLVEKVYKEGGSYLEVYEEKIDSINFIKVTPTHNEMLLRFNILENEKPDDDDAGQRFENGEFDAIASRKLYLKMLAKNMRDEALFLEKKAFDEIMEYLKSQGGYGKRVLSAFIKRLEERKGVFEKLSGKERYKVLNDILFAAMNNITAKEDLADPQVRKVFNNIINIRTDTLDWAYQNARRKVTPAEIKTRLEILKSGKEAALKKMAPSTLKPMLKIKREKEKEKAAGAASDKQKPKPKPVKKPAKAPSKGGQFKAGGAKKAGGGGGGGGVKKPAPKKKDEGNPYADIFMYQMMRRRMQETQQPQVTEPPKVVIELPQKPVLKLKGGGKMEPTAPVSIPTQIK
ncbi:MAG: hypothetical protein LBN07_01300 [Christensenellaceae bacterium]|nr:hypothetical protein [Christensenellaceae bacterium]